MANRRLNTFNQVTHVVAPQRGEVLKAAVDISSGIVANRMNAQLTSALANAQSDITELQMTYRIDNALEPEKGRDEYKAKRDAVISKARGSVSPLVNMDFNAGIQNVIINDDVSFKAWETQQNQKITIEHLNNAMAVSYKTATVDGRNYGMNPNAELTPLLNHSFLENNIESFTDDVSMPEKMSKGILSNYNEDYVKSFLSGVAEVNPTEALLLTGRDDVREMFNTSEEFIKFEKSLLSRKKTFDQIEKLKNKINPLRAEQDLLTRFEGMSYAELEQNFGNFAISAKAQSFFKQLSGYEDSKEPGNFRERTDLKSRFYQIFTEAVSGEDLPPESIKLLQDSMFDAMSKKVFTKDEGFAFLNDFIEPMIAQKEAAIGELDSKEQKKIFGIFNTYGDNIGLSHLDGIVNHLVGANFVTVEGKKGPSNERIFIEDSIRARVYDFYLQSFSNNLKEENLTGSDFHNLPYKERLNFIQRSLSDTIFSYNMENYPLESLTDSPAYISRFTTGRK